MTAERPLVSVLTPSFNQARWLPDNLRSVASQSYPAVEHIVMDGASTDSSVAILDAASRPQLKWRSEPDKGQSNALNKAFAESSGEIIGWVNSDDAYFGRDVISTVVSAFQSHPRVDVVFGHAALVNADGQLLQVLWSPAMAARLMRVHNFLWQPAVFIRRRAIVGSFVDAELELTMDWELWLRLATRARFLRVNRILAIDRHQAGRKVITRMDLFENDRATLQKRYHVAKGVPFRTAAKAFKVGFRLMGATKIREAASTPLAFDGQLDNIASLAVRQLTVPRSRMALGSPAANGEGVREQGSTSTPVKSS